jgi:two-component system, OmpR family, sensor histidine kinase QseC
VLETAGEQLSVFVRDSGPGVPANVADRLGERFFRGTDGGIEGSGLGLAIVARIAELHGARLSVGNHPDGGFEARIEGLRRQA